MQHLDDGVLNELVDGEVPSSELGPIERHLDACHECRVRLEETRAFADETDGLVNLIEMPDGSEATPPVVPRPRWGGDFIRNLAWAASLVLAVGLGYAAGNRPVSPPDETAFRGPLIGAPLDPEPSTQTPAPKPTTPAGDQLAALDTVHSPAGTAGATTTRRGNSGSQVALAEERANEVEQAAPKREAARGEAAEKTRSERVAGRVVTDVVTAAAPRAAAELESRAGRQVGDLDSAKQMRLRTADRRSTEPFAMVTLRDALGLLGGSLRLIDGLVPDRLEASETRVRVIYPWRDGELVLEQLRVSDSIAVELTGPAGMSSDSLAALRARIR